MSDSKRPSIRRFRFDETLEAKTASRNTYAYALDGLNALDLLDQNIPKHNVSLQFFGPRAYQSTDSASVRVWYLEKGFHKHNELRVFGVWVQAAETQTRVIVGTKIVAYSAPIYNAESFWALIKHDYVTYYTDDHTTPTEDLRYNEPYDITRRLAIRREVEAVIVSWGRGLL